MKYVFDPEHLEGILLRDKYQIEKRIGSGGSAVVYRAKDLVLEKTWALKVMKRKKKEIERIQFDQEVRWMKSLSHPFLPRIVDAFEIEDCPVIVMDYLKGKTLEMIRRREGRQEADTVRKWAGWIWETLIYLHNQKIVYQDLKPANVMIRKEGGIWLVDFGTLFQEEEEKKPASVVDGIQYFTGRRERVYGTPGYAAPEQYDDSNRICDNRCDQYALGMLIYAMLSGQEPEERTDPCLALKRKCPSDLLEVIGRCTEKNPDHRYQDERKLLEDLKHPEWMQGKRKQKRSQTRMLVSVILAVVCFTGGIFFQAAALFSKEYLYRKLLRLETDRGRIVSGRRISEEEAVRAIDLMPERTDGYEALLAEYSSEGGIDEKDAKKMSRCLGAGQLNLDLSDQKVCSLYLRAGMTFFCMEDFRVGIPYAQTCFYQMMQAPERAESETARAFYRICRFYQEYVMQMNPQKEPEAKEYKGLADGIKECIEGLKKAGICSSYSFMTAAEHLTNLLHSQEEGIKEHHRPTHEIRSVYQEIENIVRQTTAGSETGRKKREKILKQCAQYRKQVG
jgi:tRNA A-37 threonylcarbamoyl transferase component Bud32